MAKQKRTRLTDEQKKELINQHKEAYLSKKKVRINKEKPTVESFDALPFKEQWQRINNSIIRPTEKKKQVPTAYQQVRTRLTYIKNNVDKLTDEQMTKVYEYFEEIKEHDKEREKRREEEEAKRLAKEIETIEESLKEKKELLKLFTQED